MIFHLDLVVTGQELTDELIKQIKPFNPQFHLKQQVEKIAKTEYGWVGNQYWD